WCPLEAMRPVTEGSKRFYESPALIGAALAVSRPLYKRLFGFDTRLRSWGYEQLDFGLKCWLMGYRILHDPEAVVGHRFQTTFDNYFVPQEHVLANQLMVMYKNLTHEVWMNWLEGLRQRRRGGVAEHPERLWGQVWDLFDNERADIELERSL